ncbi:MAG: hypothetical protein AAGG68_16620 [Bacteroidota bacterium]
MKKILIVALSFISFSAFAQVKEEARILNGEEKNAFSIVLPKTEKKEVEKSWAKFIKEYKGKTKLDKKTNFTFSDDSVIKGMSNNSVDVYAQVMKKGEDTELMVWYDLGGAYLNSEMHAEGTAIGKNVLTDFALTVSKAAIEELLAAEEDILKELTKEQEKLEKDKKDYEAEIKKYEQKIQEARDNILKNAQDQATQKEKVAQQQHVVDEVKEKLKKVE